MTLSLPSSLAAAVKAAEELEGRISRTRGALATATDRAERSASEHAQAQIENDALAGDRDLAHAAIALGEVPDQDVADLDKQFGVLAKRLAAARSARETSLGAERGLRLRLAREMAERPGIMQQIEGGQAAARAALQLAGKAVFDKIEQILTAEFAPLVAAETTVAGNSLARDLHRLVLDQRSLNDPVRQHVVIERCRQTAAPADFERAGHVARQMANALSSHQEA